MRLPALLPMLLAGCLFAPALAADILLRPEHGPPVELEAGGPGSGSTWSQDGRRLSLNVNAHAPGGARFWLWIVMDGDRVTEVSSEWVEGRLWQLDGQRHEVRVKLISLRRQGADLAVKVEVAGAWAADGAAPRPARAFVDLLLEPLILVERSGPPDPP